MLAHLPVEGGDLFGSDVRRVRDDEVEAVRGKRPAPVARKNQGPVTEPERVDIGAGDAARLLRSVHGPAPALRQLAQERTQDRARPRAEIGDAEPIAPTAGHGRKGSSNERFGIRPGIENRRGHHEV